MTDKRVECVFGEKCYRRNPHHFREYKHGHLSELLRLNHPDIILPILLDREQFKIFSIIEAEFNKTDPKENKRDDKVSKEKVHNNMKRSRSPSPSSSSGQEPKKITTTIKKSNIQLKLFTAKPFNFFLTKIKDCPSTHKSLDSLYITDLLHPATSW